MIKKIYDVLLKDYGMQGWWPLTPKGGLHSLHHQGPPKDDSNRFEIMVGAILTQNTSWVNVEKALHNLNVAKALSMEAIAGMDDAGLAELIRPSGYYNQKAKKLKFLVSFIRENGGMDSLFSRGDLRDALLSVNGIGPETADSMVLYAAGKPSFVIDAYTRRIFSRVGFKAETYDEWRSMFMSSLKPDVDMFREYHALIVEHAKRHCSSKPKCERCPLVKLCKKVSLPA